jgi:Ni2+-binding GTPase involved in maturation of urease and hydrogenase
VAHPLVAAACGRRHLSGQAGLAGHVPRVCIRRPQAAATSRRNASECRAPNPAKAPADDTQFTCRRRSFYSSSRSANAHEPDPVSILTGFLGAGKTTLLNYILKQNHGYKFAVIVNEVGKIGIDGMLVENQKEEIVEMNNGCLCCTVRKDLVKGVQNLVKKGGFDYLLIETTGIADPGPVAQTFLNIPQLQQYVRLDSIITVVDSEQILKQMKETATAKEQVVMADFLLLNKTDLISRKR